MKKMLAILLVLAVIMVSVVAEGAKEEENKVLRLLTWSSYAMPELVEKFEAETGYKVELTLSNNEEMISKLRATRGGGFDLANPSVDRISAVAKQYGIYQPIDYSRLDMNQIDQEMLESAKKNTLVDGESYAVPYTVGTKGLVVNTAKISGAVDYDSLLNPEYTGKVAYKMKRPILLAMGYAFGYDPFGLYNDREAYQAYLDDMEGKFVEGKAVIKYYTENADVLLEGFRTGEIWLGLESERVGWSLHAENPDIDYVAPESGPMAWMDTFAIPSKSENLEAAYAWINFALRPENAALLTNKAKYVTASKGSLEFVDASLKADIERCLPPEVWANANWYPTIPAGLEEMEGKTLDKIRAAKVD